MFNAYVIKQKLFHANEILFVLKKKKQKNEITYLCRIRRE